MSNFESIVIGIDVGGMRRGFHAVALHEGRYMKKFRFLDPEDGRRECNKICASIIAIDAPCKWSQGLGARNAEIELSRRGIHCFATPTRERALGNSFYNWMLNGARLYQTLSSEYSLYNGSNEAELACFETFPHAIACELAGKVITAGERSICGRKLLRDNGIETDDLTNTDFVDAALCALTAFNFQKGLFKKIGRVEDGYIIVPRKEV